ncbi:MAG TPA: DUF4097 family beta strand repeat-containing protein [Bryobacteraceae bacterium]|nr:DUF4097 family beta strand repeat-containing protein [Bryobacteraceae bacterium]
MKTLSLVVLGAAFAAWGQDAGRVKIPFSDPSRPKTVKVNLIMGSITVKGYAGNEVLVDVSGDSERHRDRGDAPPGMRRIDAFGGGFQAEESENTVSITANPNRHSDLSIQVPVNTSLKLSTINGGFVEVDGVNGDLDVNNTNGKITLTHVSGAVVAHALNGKLIAELDRVDAGKAMSFSSLNGNIDVTLPASMKANVKMRSDNGEIYSDFDVKVDGSAKPVVEDNRSERGRYRVKIDRTVFGTINGGGPDIQFTTFNGNIYIRKGK